MRTLYDGQSFDILRENPAFADGSFTSNFNTGIQGNYQQSVSTGDRYRYIGELTTNGTTDRYKTAATQQTAQTRYNGTKVTLYAKGQAVAVHREGNAKTAEGRSYLGTDILGSVRSATTEYGTLEDRYEYDAFGKPYTGNFDSGIGNGYLGKPYDTATGFYNYGYRDYAPTVARFTTVDPIRDGNNWFAYVRNDPVNYVDLWGLSASDKKTNSHNTVGQVALGVAEIIGGVFTIGSTIATTLVVEVATVGTLSIGAGIFAFTGISLGSAIIADGIGRVTNALMNNEHNNEAIKQAGSAIITTPLGDLGKEGTVIDGTINMNGETPDERDSFWTQPIY